MKINLKEILVCFVLSLMATWLSRYAAWERVIPYISGVTPPTSKHGWPIKFYYQRACGIIPLSGQCPPGWIDPWAFILNLIFWFLLVFVSWQLLKFVLEFIRVRMKK